MKGLNAVVVLIIPVLLAVTFAPLAIGENDSLKVVMTVEDRHYSVGDTITIEIRVYDAGVLTDVPGAPDQNLTLQMSTNWNLNNALNLALTKLSTGTYTTTYTVTANNNNQNLYFFYDVWLATDHEWISQQHNRQDALVIDVYSIQDTIDVNFDGQKDVLAEPGDVITATVIVKTGDSLIPITGFDRLVVRNDEGIEENLTYYTEKTGIYKVNFTVPSMIRSGWFDIVADPIDIWNDDSARIYVNVLDVWYHKLSSAGQTVTFEVCVADMTGAAVSGAAVVIQRWNDVQTGTTNETGKTLFSLTDVVDTAGITGYVLYGGNNQSISGMVFNPQTLTPGNHLDIIWQGTNYYLEQGETYEQTYKAYYDQMPLGTQEIFYYVSAEGIDYFYDASQSDHVNIPFDVVASGSVTTDATGTFTIEFGAPDSQCVLNTVFEVPLEHSDFQNQDYDQNDGKYYDVWPEHSGELGSEFFVLDGNLYDDSAVNLATEKFQPGEPATITVNMPNDYGDDVIAFWGVGTFDLTTIYNYDPSWASWVPGDCSIALHKSEGGEYTGSFIVPVFIDSEDVVSVIAGYMDGATGFPHFNTEYVEKGGGVSGLLILLIIIVIVVIVFMLFILKNR